MTPEEQTRIQELRTLLDNEDELESAAVLAAELAELLEFGFKESLNNGNQRQKPEA